MFLRRLGYEVARRFDVRPKPPSGLKIAQQQTTALERLAELEQFQRLTVGRELKMIELKKEIESLRRLVGTDQGDFGDEP